jgi:tRNA A-37 threonylcarbamoyl transferase component Bud32
MSPELHRRVRELFDAALERPEGERLAFLDTACSGDAEAYRTVLHLLEVRPPAQSFLENRAPGTDRIGRYMISRELGRGAMGVVYEAVDPLIRRDVAVKVIRLESLADKSEAGFMRERLFREAHSAGQLLHPGIVVIFDVGQEGDLAFIAMERVDGLSLEGVLASGRTFDRGEMLDVLRQTAAALDYAHQKGIVHCDVKPGNIILDKSGAVKLTDFGIAKITSTQYQTRTGLLMGTPSYMSPEQIEQQALDGRSDQFSLAVVAFRLLTGRMPFEADSIAGMAYAIVHASRPSASKANPEVAARLDEVLARGLDKLPGRRFQSCTQFVAALGEASTASDRIADGPSRPTPPAPPVPPAKRRLAPARWYLAGAFALVLALVGGYVFLGDLLRDPPPPPQLVPLLSVAPEVVQFVAYPQSIQKGASATLRWEVKDSTFVVIDPVGAVGASGATEVRPDATTVYSLTATGRAGQNSIRTLRLAVEILSPGPTLFAQAEAERSAGHLQAAVSLFRQAAKLGDAGAMAKLGTMLIDGEGVTKNYSEGLRLLQTAAGRGNSSAMVQLGGMYYMGNQGVPQDYGAAAYWFRKAADAGDPTGKYDLGLAYEDGLGVVSDLRKAVELYREAAKLGHEGARKRLRQILR